MKPTSLETSLASPVPHRRFAGLATRSLLAALAVASGATTPPTEASVGGDYDGDGKADFAILRDNRVHVRSDVANASSTWTAVDLPDLPDSSRALLESGDLNGDGRDDLVVSAPGANVVVLLPGPSSPSAELDVYELPIPGGPSASAWTRVPNARGAVAHWLALETPSPYRMQTAAPATGSTVPTAVRATVSLGATETEESLDLVSLPDAKGAPGLFGWLHRAAAKVDASAVVTWFDAEPPTGTGLKYKDIQVSTLGGSAALDVVQVPTVFAGPVVIAHARQTTVVVTLFPPSERSLEARAVETKVGEHRFVRWLPSTRGTDSAAPGRLWVVSADGTGANLFRPVADGTWVVESRMEAPSGDSFSDAVALEDGGLAAMLTSRGNPSDTEAARLAVYANRDGRLVLEHTTDLPARVARAATVRVILYDRDPFRDARAVPYESWAVDDWVRDARLNGDTVEVASATFRDARRGLGGTVSRVLQASRTVPRGAFVLGNQWEPDSSLHYAGAPAAPGPASLAPSPAPGSHPGPVDVTFATAAGTTIYARTAGGAWKSGPGPYRVERTAVLEYYGVDTQGRAGARGSGLYSIRESAAGPSVPRPVDSDRDGLEDGWERRFFGSLAESGATDFDGDGFTDQQEYVGNADPRNPRSVPAAGSTLSAAIRIARSDRGGVILTWLGRAGVASFVEASEDLRSWRRVQAAPVAVDGLMRWEDDNPDAGVRFYRVTVGP